MKDSLFDLVARPAGIDLGMPGGVLPDTAAPGDLVVPDQIDTRRYPHIAQYTAYAETLEAFVSTPMT